MKSILEEIVGTQYNDMEGLISIDVHPDNDLVALCGDNGIDVEKYFPVGFGLSDSSIGGVVEEEKLCCSVLLLDREEYGVSADEIESNIKGQKSVNVIKKTFYINYTDLGNYIKQFDFMAVNEVGRSITTMNIIE